MMVSSFWIRLRKHLAIAAVLLMVSSGVPVHAGGQEAPVTATVAETYREAYDAGFRDGRRLGRSDRRRDRRTDFRKNPAFQLADAGFEADRHDGDVYKVAYRRGFEDGYEEGVALIQVPVETADPVPSIAPAAVSSNRPIRPAPSGLRRTIPAGTELSIELLDTLSTKYNERGDSFTARLNEDLVIAGNVMVPRGTQVTGAIAYLKRAGRIRGRAQINLRFDQLLFHDGRIANIDAVVVGIEKQSDEQIRDAEGTLVSGSSKGDDGKTVAKTTAGGALAGVIAGGGRGAGVGAAAGAVAGLASVLLTRGRDAQLEASTRLTIRLLNEVPLTPRP